MKNLKLYAENKSHHISETDHSKAKKQSPDKQSNPNRNKENDKSGKNTQQPHKKSM